MGLLDDFLKGYQSMTGGSSSSSAGSGGSAGSRSSSGGSSGDSSGGGTAKTDRGVTIQMPQMRSTSGSGRVYTGRIWSSGNRSTSTPVSTGQTATQAVEQTVQMPTVSYDTNRGMLAYIDNMYKTDQAGANELYGGLKAAWNDPSSPYFQPYSKGTNKALGYLNDLGVDTSNINDQWFEDFSWLKQYYKYTANTNSLSSTMTGRRASKEEKAAYQYWQLDMAREQTKQAQAEVQAAKEEIAYLLGRTDLNLSPEQIIQRLNISGNSKYKTLAKMDEGRLAGTPIELNAAIGYNGEDDLYTWIWQAMNNGGSGNYLRDKINCALGNGNVWKQNDELAAKLDVSNLDTYAPYDVGMTEMDEEGLYFGKSSFNQAWLDDPAVRARYLGSGNEKDARMYGNVYEAEQYTQKLEKERDLMMSDIDELLRYYPNDPENIIKALKDSSDYKDLFDLDETLRSGKLKKTTRAVNYRWQDMEAYIRSRCDAYKGGVEDVMNEAAGVTISEAAADSEVDAVTGAAPPSTTANTSPASTGTPVTPGGSVDTSETKEALPGDSGASGEYYGLGNIDLNHRTVVHNSDGSFSTEESITVGYDDGVVLIPTIIDGKSVSNDEAIEHYEQTGEYLGKFDTEEDAQLYAEALHKRQEAFYESVKPENFASSIVGGIKQAIGAIASIFPQPVPVMNDIERELEKQVVADHDAVAPTILDKGTDAEKTALETMRTGLFDKVVDMITNSTRDAAEWFSTAASKSVASDYLGYSSTISNYEDHQKTRDQLQQLLDELMPSWEKLTEKQASTDAIGNMTQEQFLTLQGLVYGDAGDGDVNWPDVQDILMDEEANPADRDWALEHLYSSVTGSGIPADNPEARATCLGVAQTWWDFMTRSDEEEDTEYRFMTEDDLAKLDDLTARKNEIEKRLQEENSYLEDEANLYQMAVNDKKQITENYIASALLVGGDLKMLDSLELLHTAGRMDAVPQYMTDNTIDLRVRNKEITDAEAVSLAASSAVFSSQTADQLEETLKQMDAMGVKFSDEERANIENQIKYLRDDAHSSSYVMLDGQTDFRSVVTGTKEKVLEKGAKGYEYVSRLIAGEKDIPGTMFAGLSNSFVYNDNRPERSLVENMTDKEKNRYLYLLGKEGEKAALDYFHMLTNEQNGVVTVRRSQNLTDEVQRIASEDAMGGILMTALSFATNVSGGWKSTAYEIYSKLRGKEIGVYSAAFDDTLVTGAARQGTKDQITKALGGESSPGAKIANLFYDAFTSSVDSWINAQLTENVLGFASALFSTTKIGQALQLAGAVVEQGDSFGAKLGKLGIKIGGDLAHASTMGINAAASTYRDVISRGGSEEQATRMAVATFWAETGSEAVTIGNFHESFAAGAGKEELEGFLKTWIKNGAEEALGEGVNEWIEQNAEKVILGSLSTYEQTAKKYTDQGYPETIAYAMADKELWHDVLTSAATGFISSTFGTTTEYVRGRSMRSENTTEGDELTSPDVSQPGEENQASEVENAGELTQTDVNEEGSSEEEASENTITPEQQAQDEAAVAKMEEQEAAQDSVKIQLEKDLAVLAGMASGSDSTSAAISLTSVLGGTGLDDYTTKAAAQYIVSQMANGDGKVAAQAVKELLLMPIDSFVVKSVIAQAALSNGSGHQALQTIISLVSNGQSLTKQHAMGLILGVKNDFNKSPRAFHENLAAAVKASRIANRVVEIARNNQAANTGDTTSPVDDAKEVLKGAQQVLDGLKADLESAKNALASAVTEQLQNAGDPAMNAPVEQAAEEIEGLNTSIQNQENEVAKAEANVEQAEQSQEAVETAALNEARAQAVSEVEQEMADEAKAAAEAAEAQAQQEFQDALTYYPPTKAFTKPVSVEKVGGGQVTITGIFAITPEGATIYTTPQGYIHDDEIDAGSWEGEAMSQLDAALNAWTNGSSPLYPVGWMYHSLDATRIDTGEVVHLVGFMGQTEDGDPIAIDSNGNVYGPDDIHMEPDPFTGNNGNQALFQSWEESIQLHNMPEISESDLYQMQHPGAPQMPEGFVAYPQGTITMKDKQGQEHEVVGFVPGSSNFVATGSVVLSDGTTMAVTDFKYDVDTSIDFLDWAYDWNDDLLAENTEMPIWEEADSLTDMEEPEQATPTDVNPQANNLGSEYSDGKTNPKTGEPLKNWQDPKYHGKVEKTTKKVNPKTKAFEKFFKQNAAEALPYVTNPDGTPKIFFRGYGSFGKTLYTVHEGQGNQFTMPNGKKAYYNFYMDKMSTASKYAGTSQLVRLRYAKNWETAKAAMQDIGYDLVEAPKPDGSGKMGYQVMKNGQAAGTAHNQYDTTSTWFAENELAKFRNTYGGGLYHKGVHVGYIVARKPLILDAHDHNYTNVPIPQEGITAPDGTKIEISPDWPPYLKTRKWAEWAFKHGYDSVIFKNVKDDPHGGGESGTEIVTSESGQFKSAFNKGSWNINDPNIQALKAGEIPQSKPFKDAQEELALGKQVDDMTLEERQALAKKLWNIPEIQDAKKRVGNKPSTLPWNQQSAIRNFTSGKDTSIETLQQSGVPDATIQLLQGGASYYQAIESLFTPEAVREQQRIVKEMTEKQGSVEFDENGDPHYTGEVNQNRRLDVVAGLPASGKSTLAESLSAQYGSRMLDSDDAKKLHKDYQNGDNSSPLHNESRFITDQAMGIMINNGDNVVLPVVGHSYDSIKRQIEAFKSAGYDVHLHNVDLPWSKALSRALNRTLETKRLLDFDYLTGTDSTGLTPQKIKDTFNRLVKEGLVDGYATWNNDVERGKPPVAVSYSDASEVGLTTGKFSQGSTLRGRGNAGNLGGTSGVSGESQIQALRVKNQTPTQKFAAETKAKLKSPQDIAQKLVKNLGFGDYMGSNRFGRIGKGVRGFWDTHAKYLAVKAKDLGNYGVTLHETGHGIADKLKLTGTQEMVNNLVRANPAFADNYSASQLADEAFAEFFWRYMESEERAKNFAGETFYDYFEKQLRAQPEMWNSVQESRQELQQWVAASVHDRLASMIKHDRNGDRGNWINRFRDTLNDTVEFLQKGVVDRSAAAAPLYGFVKEALGVDKLPLEYDVRANSLIANHSQKQAIAMLTDTLTDANHTVIGDGLAKRFNDVGFKGTEEDIRLLERYMLALHALEREEQRKTVFGENATEADLNAIIDDVKANRQDVVRAEEVFQDFRREFLQAWMVDTGYWTQEFFDHLNEINPHYAPTFRVREGQDGFANRTSGGVRKRYLIHEATGSSENIYSPWYSFIGMADQIVSMVNNNQAALAFDRAYQKIPGMGIWARQIYDSTQNGVVPNATELNARQQQLSDLLAGQITDDVMQQVLDIVKGKPNVNQAPSDNLLHVTRPDGTIVNYELSDPYLYRLLSGVQATTGIQGLQAIGKLTRTMSMLTTGSNPLFAARNAVRDYQNSVNYGSWASNYLTAIPKWMKSFAEVWRGQSEDYKNYVAQGGGGWTRIDQNSAKSMNEITEEMFGADRSNLGKTTKWALKKVWDVVTMDRVNEVIEQASRFAEYKYGKHDLNTAEGRSRAFLAAQDVTVDFSRRGNSGLAAAMQKLIPFFNASMQGVYRTGRQFTEAERDRVGTRFAKNVINTALTSALSLGLILKFCDDDDKEEFGEMLSDGIKANHLILPNPLRGMDGQPPFLRVPLSQDPLTYAVHSAVTNALWGGTMDETAISLAATVDVILDNLNPIGSGTIAQPFIDASHNQTWYGGSIVRSSMSDWTDPASQYNEDTPGLFRLLGRLTQTSPEVIEYLATQYTGFLGATMIPALTYNEDGSIGGVDALLQSVVKKWTADPLTSNDVTSYFYDMAADLNTMKEEAAAGRPQGLLRSNLTQEQVNQAYAELETLNKTVSKTKTLISDAYKKIDAVNSNATLTDGEKYDQTSKIRKEMLESVQVVNEQLQGFQSKYMKGSGLIDRWFSNIHEGKYAHVPTDFERLPQSFQQDANEPYMQMAQEVYDITGNSSDLPHPNREFTNNKVKYQIPDSDWDHYTEIYRDAYKASLARSGVRWKLMSDEDKSKALSDAHKAGHEAMKKRFIEDQR